MGVYFELAVTVYRGTCSEMVPYVLCGVSPREAGGVHFETINLNTQAQWFDNPSPSKSIV